MKKSLKKNLTFIILLFAIHLSHAQELYIATGKNFTSYNFIGTDNLPLTLKSRTGDSYELLYKLSLDGQNDRFFYAMGIALNEFNASGGDTVNNYEWMTTYIGLQNYFEFKIIPHYRNPIDLSAAFQMQLMTIINGEQKINGNLYDLTKENEFKGFWVQPGFSVMAKYYISEDLQFGIGYNNSTGLNLSNKTDEKLSFNNQQVLFSLHFILN